MVNVSETDSPTPGNRAGDPVEGPGPGREGLMEPSGFPMLQRVNDWVKALYPTTGRTYTVRLERGLWVQLGCEIEAKHRYSVSPLWPFALCVRNVRFLPRATADELDLLQRTYGACVTRG
jgi:hypothetical protein